MPQVLLAHSHTPEFFLSCVCAAYVVVLQLGSSSAYLETLSQVREVAETVAAAEMGSPMDERAQVMVKAVETLLRA